MVTAIRVGYFLVAVFCFVIGLAIGWWVIANCERGRALVDLIAVGVGSLALIPAVLAFTNLVRWDQGKIAFFTSLDDKEPIYWLAFAPLLLSLASGLALVARCSDFRGG